MKKLVLLLLSIPSICWALPNLSREATIGADLKYKLESEWYRAHKDVSNQLFRPVGFEENGKYPVVLILPTCGGIRSQNHHQMHFWVREFVRGGFLTMVVDSTNSRGLRHNCGRDRSVEDGRLMKDVVDAIRSLNAIPYVNSERIFTVGFSQGAMTNFLLGSPSARSEIDLTNKPIRAMASLYGICRAGTSGSYVWLRDDTDVPLLILGGKADAEAPFSDCESAIKSIKEGGRSVDFHLYEGLSHAWDNEGLNNFSKTAPNGNTVKYVFDESARKDSKDRIIRFFDAFK